MKRFLSAGLFVIFLAFPTAAQRKQRLTFSVPFNHLYVVLDSATYADIENNQFLQTEFAVFERRTTVRADRTYTGLYFYGINTYFEFFDVSKETGSRIGNSGIAFGVERPGALQMLQTSLNTESPILITRQVDDRKIPWFFSIAPNDFPAESAVTTWLMEYHPRFLSEWHPQSNQSNQGIDRKQILKRYRSILKNVPARPYLKDVIGLTVAADRPIINKLTKMCELLGYRSRTNGEVTVLKGYNFTLRLLPVTTDLTGVRQVTFRIRRVPKGEELRFGSQSVLKFNSDNTATWSF